MSTEHPITPPPELVQAWTDNAHLSQPDMGAICRDVATQAARWGADRELDECCEWCADGSMVLAQELRDARRPKPPSLKEQALEHLQRYASGQVILTSNALDTIRRALEQLPE